MRAISLAFVMLAGVPALASAPEELAALDALYGRRGEAEAVKELEAALDTALQAAPEDFERVWRKARLRHWQADGATQAEQKKLLGKQVWELGERARKLRPERVEGHFYAAVGIGSYSQAVGILAALSEGLEGKFNERLEKALALDPGFEWSGPWLTKGRYFYELPWPKRDLKKSADCMKKALALHPESLRGWLFLAETLLEDGKAKQAHEALLKVLEGSVAYDPPEGLRMQARARKLLARVEKELK
jgi:tetratricopeptide (TPR) repeat protein